MGINDLREDFGEPWQYAPRRVRDERLSREAPPRLPNAPQLSMADHHEGEYTSSPWLDDASRQAYESSFEGDIAARQLRWRSLVPDPVSEPEWSLPKTFPLGMLIRTTAALGVATVGGLLYVGILPVPFAHVAYNVLALVRQTPVTGGPDAGPSPTVLPAGPALASADGATQGSAPGGSMDAPAFVAAAAHAVEGKLEPAVAAAAAPTVSPAPAAPQAAAPSTRPLDPAEIDVLIRHSQTFIAQGDLVAARGMLRRATEAGSARAALMLGGTFDPELLRELGVIGMKADTNLAREWYERAIALGSAEAVGRLDRLGR